MTKSKWKAFLTALALLTATLGAQGMPAAARSAKGSEIPEGTYLFRNCNSGSYMDVENGTAKSGTNVQQWGASAGGSQNVWHVVPDGDGYYRIYTMAGDGTYCMSGDTASVTIQEQADTDAQRFRFAAESDGTFTISPKSSDGAKVVEVINADSANGADVQIWAKNGASCQYWELVPIDYVSGTLTPTPYTNQTAVTDLAYEIAGDLNKDGVVNGFDLSLLRQLVQSHDFDGEQTIIGDVNADFALDAGDARVLQQYLLGNGTLQHQEYTGSVSYLYAAIDGTYTEGVTETKNTGFHQEAYLNLDNAAEVSASWNVTAVSDGLYEVTFRYANGGETNRDLEITVGNQLVYWTAEMPATGGWESWSESTVILPLEEGVNHLTITSVTDDGAPNLDEILITETAADESPSQPLKPLQGIPEEAENPPVSGGTGNQGTYGVDRQLEALDRGVTAAYTGSGMLVSWRSLATDSENTTFKLYQNGSLVTEIGADAATNYLVSGGTASDQFTVDTYVDGVLTESAQPATILGNKNSGQSGAYLDIPLQKPADQTMPDGSTCSYTPNDCSVGDVDGDGAYEIIVKWDPSNSQDNSKDGYTGTVFLDCYEMDGTQLWRIDLGINIRAGAHYTQFMVYDFDADGKAELMCKTSDGTKDGTGTVIGSSTADYRSTAGRILTGNEYLTLFDGQTGAALDTIDYEPGRGTVSEWGDPYGNRVDRFLAGVAYLDGATPSAIFCRGYYTRTAIAAYDVQNQKIVKRWIFDTGNDATNPYYGQGNHSLAVMDVDADGKDEIIYGSCCIDDNGKGLWSTGLGHGDCMQAGDLIPDRDGLEIFQVHEEHYCAEIHDAATGEVIWQVDGAGDVGRGIALNLTADYPGMIFASVADNGVYYYNPETKKVESTGKTWSDCAKWGMNSAVWWDGDLEREALDRTMVEKMGASRVFTGDGVTYNNSSKSNACLTADLFGDWREEMIFPTSDGTALRVFGTTYATDTKLFTLMQDSQYRTGVAIENVAYNQAPNTSFFLGTGYPLPETPTIYTPSGQ